MTDGVLDVGILEAFGAVFTMLLIFVIVYGFLTLTNFFGDKKGLYGIIAFTVAVLSLINPGILFMIGFMAPWFFLMIFIAFFILFALMIFGLKREQMEEWELGANTTLRTTVITITVVIFLAGLAVGFGQDALGFTTDTAQNQTTTQPGPGGVGEVPTDVAGDDFLGNVVATFINPNVLGLIVIMLVGAFAAFFLARPSMY